MFQRLPGARQFFFLGLFSVRSALSFFTVGCSDGDAVSSLPDLPAATGSGGAAAGTGGNGDTRSTDATVGSGGSSGTTGDDAGNGGALLDGDAGEETVVGSGGTAGGTTSADARQEADAVSLPEASPDGGPNPLTLCLRLTSLTTASFDVTFGFELGLIHDCRESWVERLYHDADAGIDQRADFVARMQRWNLDFWGCTPTVPTDFPLLFTPSRITPDDADAIISIYVASADASLRLDSDEKKQMTTELRRLAQQDVDDGPSGFPRSVCDAGAIDAAGNGDGS